MKPPGEVAEAWARIGILSRHPTDPGLANDVALVYAWLSSIVPPGNLEGGSDMGWLNREQREVTRRANFGIRPAPTVTPKQRAEQVCKGRIARAKRKA